MSSMANMFKFWLTLTGISLLLPFYLLFNLLRRIKRSMSEESVAGKVVLITGASSGIGEHIAYEYARRGACLVLGARREDRLKQVANKAQSLGSPEVIVVQTDVTKTEDCKIFVNEAVQHFGQLDVLVNNAGIASACSFEDSSDVSTLASIMDTNFLGSLYCTHFAIPHLKKSKGRIVAIASILAWIPQPKMSIYNASKAAMVRFFETLRVECGSSIGITIVTPGVIHSEIVTPHFLSENGWESVHVAPTDECAKAMVDSACHGDFYFTVPIGDRILFWLKVLYPELVEWYLRRQLSKTQCAKKKE